MTLLPATGTDPVVEAVSPLTLSHHLLSLAEQAHRAGMSRSAGRLLRLAHSVGNDLPASR